MTPRLDLQARKAHLAEAVWQVILSRGMSAVSVRTVAEQAGVVVGSLRHVFPSRSELVRFSAELMLQRATERALATPWNDDPEQYAFSVIECLLPLSVESRAEFEVNTALMAEAVAVPELVAVRDEAHKGLAEVSLRLIELLSGVTREDADLEPQARRLHALINGLAFNLMHQPLEDDSEWAREIVRAELSNIRSSGAVPSSSTTD